MQTINLIIPMAGFGKRFKSLSFNNYKTLLEVENNVSILDKLISNFKHNKLNIILIINREIYLKYQNSFDKKKFNLIIIDKHDHGPLYTILKAKKDIKKIIKNSENIFVCYSDINWIWDFKNVKKFLKNKNVNIFTHSGYHPHLEVNSKSDFCKLKKNIVQQMSQKKVISNDYKKDHLAIGCYYFKKFDYIENYFKNNFLNKNNEYYIVSIINYLIKRKIKVTSYQINKFVHLGIPDQYIDYLNWKDEFKKKSVLNFKKNNLFFNPSTVMLMAGKGNRVKNISKKKFLITIKNQKIYELIFNIFNTDKKYIITNKENLKDIKNKNKYQIYTIKKNNSMFQTINSSSNFLMKKKNFFLTSCDCYGNFEFTELIKKINQRSSDIIFFAFNFSGLQKKLSNSHTQLIISNNKVKNIRVKLKFNKNYLGHAGFFWIKDGNIFNHISNFKKNYKKGFGRELIIDDYFKYLIEKKIVNASYLILKNYIHVGSDEEYLEYKYWQNYFNG